MRKIYFFIGMGLFMMPFVGTGQVVVFSENIGTPTGTTTITAYSTATSPATFQNKGTLTYFNGSQINAGDVRNTSPSIGYTGASGNGNVYFTTTSGAYGFSIEGINASAYNLLTLQFGYRKESASSHAVFSVDYWDGSSWIVLGNSSATLFNETASAASNWYLSKLLSLPLTAQINGLKIRFVKTGTVAIRIDDIILKGTATCSSPTLTGASQSATVCANTAANFNLSGMVPNSTGNAIDYTINVVAQTQVTGVSANGSGNASFTSAILAAANNGQTLQITKITNGSCNSSFTHNVTLSVSALPSTPASPTSIANPSCGPTTLSPMVPPFGETYYWQGINPTGISTSNSTTVSYNVSASGTYYVRSQNTVGCWSTSSGSVSVIINSPITITTQPTNQTVTAPAAATFSVVASGSIVSYQWERNSGSGWASIPVGAPYSGTTTPTLTINPSTGLDGVSYRCFITGTAPCGNLTSDEVQLTVVPGPCITDASGYTGWLLNAGATISSNQACSSNGILFAGQGQSAVTPAITNPLTLNFNKKRSGTATSWELKVQISTSATGPWTDVYTTSTTSGFCLANPSIDLSAYTGTQYARFLDNRPVSGAEQRGIDDITITCGTVCTPTHTITSFAPASGPVGTIVTITGTNFTGATTVKFGTQSSIFTVINSTTIIAEAPSNIPFDKLRITKASCDAVSPLNFTPITATGSCGTNGSGSTVTDISISEVYDAESGSLSYIEIFNGTAFTVTLGTPNNYVLRVNTGAIVDYPLSGTIASGGTYIIRLGSGVICSNVTSPNLDLPGASGFNGDDRIYLRKNAVDKDYVPNPNYPSGIWPGFSQRRKATTTATTIPSTTYTATDWIVSTTEDCSNLSVPPYTVSANSITINTQPADESDCSAISFTVVATSSAPPPVYLWKYLDKSTGNWVNASGIINPTLGVSANNTTTATMTITGNTAHLKDYQFYCELQESSCINVTNAVQYTYPSLPVYRSKVGTGNWSALSTWEMSTDGTNFTSPVCNYPIALNSDQVVIKTGNNITLDLDVDVDKLLIDAGAALTSSPNSELVILNGNAGADFTINGTGTYVDGANSSNSILFNSGATWSIGGAATLVKTADGSSSNYRDNFEGGIAAIPATANWIYRHTGTSLSFASSTVPTPMYYPNLVLENSTAGIYSSAINNAFPDLSTFTLTGANNPVTIKGNLNVGGAGTGNISFANINTSALVSVGGTLTVKTGSTLQNGNVNHQGLGFDVKGDIAINGTFKNDWSSSSLLKLSGTINQNVSGTGITNLQDVTIANTGSAVVTINKSQDIPGVLTFDAGSALDLQTGNINLKSTASATARVAPVGAGTSISYSGQGRFVVERFYPQRRAWRLVTAPITAEPGRTIFRSWQKSGTVSVGEGTFVTGPLAPANGLDVSPLMNYSLKTFTGVGLIGVDDTKNMLLSGKGGVQGTPDNFGMFLFVRGDRSTSNLFLPPYMNNTTLRDTGKIQFGSQTFTNSTGPIGFNLLIGNPFASPVDIGNVLLSSTGINKNLFYVYDPYLNSSQGGYITFLKSGANFIPTPTSPGGLTKILQSSQAVYVEKTSTVSSIVFAEIDKSSAPVTALFRSMSQPSNLRVNLLITTGAGSNILADGIMALFQSGGNNRIDINDATKYTNTLENLSLRRESKLVSVEVRDDITKDDTLYLNLTRITPRKYQFSFEPENLDPLLNAFLEDSYTKTKMPLSLTMPSVYDFTVNGMAASAASDRFRIVFKTSGGGPLPVTFTNINAYEQGKNISVEWTVQQEVNISKYEVEKSIDGVNFTSVNTTAAIGTNRSVTNYNWLDEDAVAGDNFYRIRSVDVTGKTSFSRIVKVDIGKVRPGINVYPNPVAGGVIGLQFSNMPKGKYQLHLYNSRGQVLFSKQLNHVSVSATQTITPNTYFPKGIYQLEIIHPDKTKTTLKVIN